MKLAVKGDERNASLNKWKIQVVFLCLVYKKNI